MDIYYLKLEDIKCLQRLLQKIYMYYLNTKLASTLFEKLQIFKLALGFCISNLRALKSIEGKEINNNIYAKGS